LRAAIDADSLLLPGGSRPVVGRVSNGLVRLRKRIGYRNSFQTYLIGSLEQRNNVTVFRGKAGMNPLVAAFMALWFVVLILIGGAGLVAGRQPLEAMIIPPLMMVFGVAGVWLGRWLARSEKAFLIAFVAEVIAASRAPDSEPGTPT